MDMGQAKRGEAIQQLVEEQEQLLRGLLSLIDTLVDRNPTESKPDVAQKHDNVFDEIIDNREEYYLPVRVYGRMKIINIVK